VMVVKDHRKEQPVMHFLSSIEEQLWVT